MSYSSGPWRPTLSRSSSVNCSGIELPPSAAKKSLSVCEDSGRSPHSLERNVLSYHVFTLLTEQGSTTRFTAKARAVLALSSGSSRSSIESRSRSRTILSAGSRSP